MSTTENADRFRLRVQTSPHYSIGAVKMMWEPQYGAKFVRAHWSDGRRTHSTTRNTYSRELFVPCLPDGATCEFWLTAESKDGTPYKSEVVIIEVENKLQRDVEQVVAAGGL